MVTNNKNTIYIFVSLLMKYTTLYFEQEESSDLSYAWWNGPRRLNCAPLLPSNRQKNKLKNGISLQRIDGNLKYQHINGIILKHRLFMEF